MPDESVVPPPVPRKSCLRRALGCAGTAGVFILLWAVFYAVVPGWDARASRRAVKPGMTASQALAAAGPWFVCEAVPEPPGDRSGRLRIIGGGIHIARTGEEVRVAGPEERGRVLEERMRATPGPWTLNFAYVTSIPKRMYFTVYLDEKQRVVRVGEAGWGILN